MSQQLLALVRLIADGKFHSGDELGRVLGVGRAAIWKSMKKLAELGLNVDSVKGKGYRLTQPLELLERDAILASLSSTQLEKIVELELLGVVDSTNSHVLRRVQKDGLDLSKGRLAFCLAEQQSSGKGRRGREWISPFGRNMYLSVGREFNSGVAGLEGLSLVVGLSLVKALERCGISDLGLKWPNDVQWKNQKLAGILLEMTGDVTGVCQVVIGLGLNIQLEQDDMVEVEQPWIDLARISSQMPSRNQIISYVFDELMKILDEFEKCGFVGFRQEWEKYDVLRGAVVEVEGPRVQGQSGNVSGVAEGVNDKGAFLLRTEHGLTSYNGGEVSLRKQRSNDS